MNVRHAEYAARLLELVANGEMNADDALSQWPFVDKQEPLFDASWHDLSHFAADADVRQRDHRYAEYQRGLLLKRAQQIRSTYPRT
jgi:hypothetical protein